MKSSENLKIIQDKLKGLSENRWLPGRGSLGESRGSMEAFTGASVVLRPFFLETRVCWCRFVQLDLRQVMMRRIFTCQIWRSSWRRCGRRRWTLCLEAAGLRWRSTPISHQRGRTLWLLEGEWWAGPSPTGWRRRRGCGGQWRWLWWRRTWRWGCH